MSERHKRKNAREMLSKAGYKSGGHFATKKMIGESVREHEGHLHSGEPKTKLKLKDGGTVQGAAFGARIHKPRSHKPKKPHTQVNVMVGAPQKQPVPVPVPIGGPPPIGPGAPMPPGGLPGQMPPGANRGGRYAKGGKVESQRDPIKSTSGDVEGKLKSGGKAKKLYMGGMSPGGPGQNAPLQMRPSAQQIFGGPSASSGGGNTVMGMGPPGGGGGMSPGGPGQSAPLQGRPPISFNPVNEGLMNRGGKAKVKHVIDDGAGGGLGRLEKAKKYGAKV